MEKNIFKDITRKYTSDLLVAKRDYREAYDSGDTEKLLKLKQQ